MKTSIKLTGIIALITIAFQTAYADPSPEGKAKFQAAKQVCEEKLNITLSPGASLDPSTRADFRSCMRGEGITLHRHHHNWKAIQACVTAAGVTLPAFTPGVRPTLTAAQKTAIKTCRLQVRAARKASQTSGSASTQ